MWDVIQNRRVLVGEGQSGRIAEILKDYAPGIVFLLAYDLTAPGVLAAQQGLDAAGIRYVADASVQGEPSTEDVDRLTGRLRALNASAVLAIGGGSVMDAAKAAALLATHEGTTAEYQSGARMFAHRPLPLVAIPTTAGTGSEATKVSVLYNPQTRLKKSIYSPDMIAEAVILDPGLTAGLPPDATISTGVDAMSHAIESLVSLNATPYTRLYGLGALRLVREYLPRCVNTPGDIEAREQMLLASYMGGVAIGAGIGLAHIIAQPLGGLLHIPHGVACAVLLPHAMEYNLSYATPMYCEIARVFGAQGDDSPALAEEGVRRVRAFLKALPAPDSIRDYVQDGFDLHEAVRLVCGATGHIKCNPRPVTEDVIRRTISAIL